MHVSVLLYMMTTTVPAAVVAVAVAAAVAIVASLQFLRYLMKRKKTVKEKDEDLLAKVYYDPSQPEGYAGASRLKKKFPKTDVKNGSQLSLHTLCISQ